MRGIRYVVWSEVLRKLLSKRMGAELVQGDLCYPKAYRLHLLITVIDAATSRPTDSLTIKQVDWDGKVALIQAAKLPILSVLSSFHSGC